MNEINEFDYLFLKQHFFQKNCKIKLQMNKIFLQNLLFDLEVRINDYQNQIELKVLEKANFILQVGALTVSIDANGIVNTQNVPFPTQFTKKAVDEILTLTFRNGFGNKIQPKNYSRVSWYSEKLSELKETFNLFKSTEHFK